VAQLPVSPMQVFLNHFQVLSEENVLLSVLLTELGSLDQSIIELLSDPYLIPDQFLPNDPSQFSWHSFLQGFFEFFVALHLFSLLQGWKELIHPSLDAFLILLICIFIKVAFEDGLEGLSHLIRLTGVIKLIIIIQVRFLLSLLHLLVFTNGTFVVNNLLLH